MSTYRREVFDATMWELHGNDCKKHPDNDCFFRPATIVREYKDKYGRDIIDVKFDGDNPKYISKGHFKEFTYRCL